VTVEAGQHVRHVALRGELDLVGAPQAARAIAEALVEPGVEAVVLHFNDVSFIDSSGLRVLVVAVEAAARRGIDLRMLPGSLEMMATVEAASLAGRLPFVGWP
jgi:anti-anti-sigma factor